MTNFVRKFNRLLLVFITTSVCVFLTVGLLFLGYRLFGVDIRNAEIIISIVAPASLAFIVTWYLFGLIKRNYLLEEELKKAIQREKENIYYATIHSSQHITNNMLHQLQIVDVMLKKNDSRDKISFQMNTIIDEGTHLMQKLSNVEKIDPDIIKNSVAPRSSHS